MLRESQENQTKRNPHVPLPVSSFQANLSLQRVGYPPAGLANDVSPRIYPPFISFIIHLHLSIPSSFLAAAANWFLFSTGMHLCHLYVTYLFNVIGPKRIRKVCSFPREEIQSQEAENGTNKKYSRVRVERGRKKNKAWIS